jgi:hypothetical protein
VRQDDPRVGVLAFAPAGDEIRGAPASAISAPIPNSARVFRLGKMW